MKLDTIYDEWDKDAHIDRTDLGEESLKIPKLHAKWHRIYTTEKLLLKRQEADLKLLKHSKGEFYLCGPSKEQMDDGWDLPPRGKILKADIPSWIEADKQVIDMSLKIGLQQEKVSLLESIVRGLQSTTGFSSRATQIKNAIEWIKWTQGG